MQPLRSGNRNGLTTKFLGSGDLRCGDPHARHRSAPELRNLSEADCGGPRSWPRAVVVQQRRGPAADGGVLAVRRQSRRPFRYGAHRRSRRCALCGGPCHACGSVGRNNVDRGQRARRHRHVGRGVRPHSRSDRSADPGRMALHCARGGDRRRLVRPVCDRAVCVNSSQPSRQLAFDHARARRGFGNHDPFRPPSLPAHRCRKAAATRCARRLARRASGCSQSDSSCAGFM